MRKVKLNDIRLDGGTQFRVAMAQDRIYHYRDRMKEGDIFPPIQATFDGKDYWLFDGFHRYQAMKLLGIKEVEIVYKPGDRLDAIRYALEANAEHGLPLTNEDKKNKVLAALELPEYKDASDRQIAIKCKVSVSFVSAIRNPEVAKKQRENYKRHIKNKVAKEQQESGKTPISSTTPLSSTTPPDPYAGAVPDEDEIKAVELASQANIEALYKILDADEPLKEAQAEIERLNKIIAQMEIRFKGLMNEKNEAIKMVKDLQKQLDKSRGKK